MSMHDGRPAILLGDTAAVIEFYPPEGVPTGTPSAKLYPAGASDDDTAEVTSAPTIDSVSLTVTTASGASQANRRRIYLTTTTGLTVGRWYAVTNALGQRETVRIASVSASTYADVDADLVYDYAITTSTVKGIRLYFTVNSTWVADVTKLNNERLPWRLRWSYTVDSVVRVRWTYLDLVRRPKNHTVTAESLFRRAPDLRGQRPVGAATWDDLIEAGYRQLCFDLRVEGCPVNELGEAALVDELTVDATLLLIARNGLVPPGRDVEAVVTERASVYSTNRSRALQSRAMPQTAQATGAITLSASKRENLWFDA